MKLNGIAWLLFQHDKGALLLEHCPKKREKLGVGRWFIPGGKIERGESPEQALIREMSEEWPEVTLLGSTPLPIVQGSPTGDESALFLMRPFIVTISGKPPDESADGIVLRWFSTLEVLMLSPVPQVRMMLAAALTEKK